MAADESTSLDKQDTDDIERRIVAILGRLGGPGDPEEILRELDSIGLVELVVTLEEEFMLEIPDEALADDVFSCIATLARTVRQLRDS